MISSFWKKRPVTFIKDEEVEISLQNHENTLPQNFITSVINQSLRKVLLQLPLSRKEIILPGKSIVVHFRRKNQLGSFKSTVAEIFNEDIPPSFSITIPTSVFWEEIVPSRLAEREFLRTKERRIFLQVTSEEKVFDAVLKQVGEEGLIFSAPIHCEPGSLIKIVIGLPGKAISYDAQVVNSVSEGDGFAITISLTDLSEEDRAGIIEYYKG